MEPAEPMNRMDPMNDKDDARLLTDDTAVIDVGALEVIHATGNDRVAFLHRLLTGDVAGTATGRGSHSLLLTLKGHVASDIRLFTRPDELRLVVAPGQGEPTAAALSRYAVMDDFAVSLAAARGPLALYGPRSFDRLAAAGLTVPDGFATRAPWSHEDAAVPGGGALWLVQARGFGASGVWVFGEADARAKLATRLAASGVGRLAAEAAEALRILAGEPRFGAEVTPEYFPMEMGLSGAIDYDKGCYLGQEPIVRIRDRGHINWRLVGLRLRGDATPERGDPLESDVKPRAGRVTSAARLPGQPPVALAMLHVSVGIGAEVRVRRGEAALAAQVVEVPSGG